MAIQVYWLLENHIIKVDIQGEPTLQEIAIATAETVAALDTTEAAMVHAIHDSTGLVALPPRIHELATAVRQGYNHPRLGWTVACNVKKPMLGFLGNFIGQMFHIQYRIVDTYPDALQFLQNEDPTLPDLSKVSITDKNQ